MVFRHQKPIPNLSPLIHLHDTQIPQKESTKILGFTLDENLTWGPHIEELLAKCHHSSDVFDVHYLTYPDIRCNHKLQI